jgi:multiple sugar transport system permease protein
VSADARQRKALKNALSRRHSTQSSRRRRLGENLYGLAFVGPLVLGLIVFTYGPVAYAAWLSFNEGDYIRPLEWVGLDNYIRALNDELVGKALENTAYFVLGTVPAGIALSLLLALAMNQNLRGIVVYRGVFFLPTITSAVAISLMWMWMYNPEFGVINTALKSIGIKGPKWLASPDWAMPSIIIMAVWRGLGYNMLLFLAGLQGIPKELLEAAEIDGANAVQRFFHVTFPLLSPTTFMLVVLSIIGGFQVFEYSYVMTGGGPLYSTLTIVLLIYQRAFQTFEMGYASALAYALFAIIMVMTIIQLRLQSRWVHYEL